jgi:hypothetical protein
MCRHRTLVRRACTLITLGKRQPLTTLASQLVGSGFFETQTRVHGLRRSPPLSHQLVAIQHVIHQAAGGAFVQISVVQKNRLRPPLERE